MAALRAELGDSDGVPLGRETLREFFSRCSVYWNSEVLRLWHERANSGGNPEPLSDKEIKREAFKLAEMKYNAVLPLLSRLAELEEQQAEMELSEVAPKRNSRR
jgi:hypothetical protein